MFLLSDIITYIRRIIKTPTNEEITDGLLIDYINRFWINDVDARLQVFDLKKKYSFQTTPGVDRYNMPLYDPQIESPNTPDAQQIGLYPVYQGFLPPCYVNGIQVPFQTQRNSFFNIYPNVVQNFQGVATGDGGASYTIQLPILPANAPPNPPINSLLRGHVDIAGIIATGNNIDPPLGTAGVNAFNTNIPVTSVDSAVYITAIGPSGQNVVVADSGQFLDSDLNYGILMSPGNAPLGNTSLAGGSTTTLNSINYETGTIQVTFPVNIPSGNNINVQCFFFQSGLPRTLLFYNNTLTLRAPPAQQYLVELDAYLTPAAFLNTGDAVAYGYMSEYIARGAARKILSDTGDLEQFQFYEPLFREQELLVWKRSQRQWTSTRTETIYSQGFAQSQTAFNSLGGNP